MKDWMEAVERHHAMAKEMATEHDNYVVLWTALVGSQNYGLESDLSDCDTFTIILPNYFDFISNAPLISFEREVEDGKVMVKDFRLMMNLLRKTSPNSIEVFSSKYKIFEPDYYEIELSFFNPDTMYYLIHANHRHMVNAVAGMAKQLHGRNMTHGKRLSHALRLEDTVYQYLNTDKGDVLSFHDLSKWALARGCKYSLTPEDDDYAIEQLEQVNAKLQQLADEFQTSPEQQNVEYTANRTIGNLQLEATKIYLKNNGFEYKE